MWSDWSVYRIKKIGVRVATDHHMDTCKKWKYPSIFNEFLKNKPSTVLLLILLPRRSSKDRLNLLKVTQS